MTNHLAHSRTALMWLRYILPHMQWENTSGYSSCPEREVVRIPDLLRNPGYTAYGGCIAYGGLRATAGEFCDFNHHPHLVEVVEPLTSTLTYADSLVRMFL